MSKSDIVSEWFHQYSHDVYDFLVYYTGNRDVEDLVQEVFIKAIKGLKTFKQQSSPKTWLFSIARNVAIDDARKRNRKKLVLTSELDDMLKVDQDQMPENLIDLNEKRKELYIAIHSLKPNYRDAVVLRGLKELSVAETAAVLDWKEEKVRTTYYRALKALRKKRGGVEDE
ncbi:RNA polymerase sigma factor [Salinibacillus xinjiangensis]|uniref:RNA polymerase sigma factor n=1 Tax=Salinibacillus xinjiangensis TaxID=1229268 RepID=A0A6G1X781_9BACI|nr:RNA polymerase sigma factor [Salinibacillus xinjiangensis]MRG86765.1 sigma-70 family RNA polymerase sigma factor [Salinibacillus xinjiangensis]